MYICVVIIHVISPNEVFGEIMVLASPRPNDVNALTQKIFNGSLSNYFMRADNPLRYVAIEIYLG